MAKSESRVEGDICLTQLHLRYMYYMLWSQFLLGYPAHTPELE